MPIEVLILLSQALQDPASGAARSIYSLGTMLARARNAAGLPCYHVRFLGATATENAGVAPDAMTFLSRRGLSPTEKHRPFGRVLQCQDHGIECTLLDTSPRPEALSAQEDAALDCLLDELVADRLPDIVITFGGNAAENARRRRLHALGSTVLFRLSNWGYLRAPTDFFSPAWGIDAVLAASDYLKRRYQAIFSFPACTTVFPIATIEETVVALERPTPGAVTFVNPTNNKGVMVFVRIVDELARRRPDIPFLVVESRGRARDLWAAGYSAGLELPRLPNLRVIANLPQPRDIFALTRILLVPSVWDEPCGRLVGEALLNGVPPIVSDRGGLPDECRGAGFIIPLPRHISPQTVLPLTVAEAEPWLETIVRLWDSPEAYAIASESARRAAQSCQSEVVSAQALEFFARLVHLRSTTPLAQVRQSETDGS